MPPAKPDYNSNYMAENENIEGAAAAGGAGVAGVAAGGPGGPGNSGGAGGPGAGGGEEYQQRGPRRRRKPMGEVPENAFEGGEELMEKVVYINRSAKVV